MSVKFADIALQQLLRNQIQNLSIDLDNFIQLGVYPYDFLHLYMDASETWDMASHIASDSDKTRLADKFYSTFCNDQAADPIGLGFVFSRVTDEETRSHARKTLQYVIEPGNLISRFITISAGLLYVIARLILLTLSFCAFRSAPEGLYATTWTTFLPNIS